MMRLPTDEPRHAVQKSLEGDEMPLFWSSAVTSAGVVRAVRLGRVANWNALNYSRLSIY
jgi:hypothetical protein